MDELVNLIKENELWVVLAAFLLINPKPVTDMITKMLGKVSPAFAEAQKRKLQQAELERLDRRERETDAIVALKETLLSYRKELADSKEERITLQRELIEVIRQYERKDQQVIEVLKDMCEAIKEQTARLDQVTSIAQGEPESETEVPE